MPEDPQYKLRWMAAGLCLNCQCRKEDSRLTKTLCEACSNRHKGYRMRRRQAFKDLGLCVECGRERIGSGATKKYCEFHANKMRARIIERDRQRTENEIETPIATVIQVTPVNRERVMESRKLWNKLGWCIGCGHPHRKVGTRFCKPCFDTMKERKHAS